MEAGWWLALFRTALWVLPFQTVYRFSTRSPAHSRPQPGGCDIPPAVMGALIARVARAVPRASCLTQAMAAHRMLSSRGYHPRMHFGGRTDQGKFEAHAWIEINGEVILGKAVADSFVHFRGTALKR